MGKLQIFLTCKGDKYNDAPCERRSPGIFTSNGKESMRMLVLKNCRFLFLFLFLLLSSLSMLVSCGPKTRQAVSSLDTPEHHFLTGMKMLDQGRSGDAQREFDLALSLNPEYSRAHVGVALVRGSRNNFSGGGEALKRAWSHAGNNEDKVFVHVGYIRVNTLSHAYCMQVGATCEKIDGDWLEKSRGEFEKAIELEPRSAAAFYFMGLCFKTALDLDSAESMFARVLEFQLEHFDEADREWSLVQKIKRARPGTTMGKQIALVDKLSRADAAALLMEELKIDVLYRKRTSGKSDTTFKYPEEAGEAAAKARLTAVDIAVHPLKADIEGILNLGVRGLELYPDGTYRPDAPVDRATYAMMIEDILIKASGDKGLATRFIGERSPFPDLRSDLPYFNAVMVMTSRGFMKAADAASGEFVPLEPVTGADALLIIREIRKQMKLS